MLVAFVESIKYVGHILPVTFLRVFLGYYYFTEALLRARGDFLSQAYLAEDIRAHLPRSTAPEWFKAALESIVIPNWQIFAVVITVIYFAVGISYLVGYMVRPFSMIAVLLGVAMIAALGTGPSTSALEAQSTLLIVVHFILGWLGAGRCLGVDYYFYKRRRGIWW
jgi:thiosulfate dehydrogenase (quinone) large subunit